MTDRCDRIWEIDALREGRLGAKDAAAFERHLQHCDICSKTRVRDERLRTLAAELPSRAPTPLDVRRVRAHVLRDVELEAPRHAPWRLRGTMTIALVACGLAIFFFHRQATNPAQITVVSSSPAPVVSALPASSNANAFAGSVVAQGDARWTQARDSDVEHVSLEDGALDLHVRHQTPTEHFFVDLPDGQIEVRGTTFHVEAHHGVTTRIEVSEGVVTVRLHGADEISITAGRGWTRTASANPRSSKADGGAHALVASSHLDQGESDDYASAVTLMRTGSYDAAATAFAAFLAAHPHASQAEDASYLEASALARAGRADAAALAAEHHLAAYPQSFHGKDAAILVARAARDRGDCAKARAVLAPWLGANVDADAQAALRSCAAP
ncbi:MAG: FecR domain-containing protein [Polyangiaceae bacterium]